MLIHITQQLLYLTHIFCILKMNRKHHFMNFDLPSYRHYFKILKNHNIYYSLHLQPKKYMFLNIYLKVKTLSKLREKYADIVVRLEIVKILLIFVQLASKKNPLCLERKSVIIFNTFN